jgi:hypothetical protein
MNIPTGTLISNSFFPGYPRGYYLLLVFLLEAFFLTTNSQKIWFLKVALEITVTNKIPVRIFSLGT